MRSNTAPLLSVQNLHVDFHQGSQIFSAVKGVSFTLDRGETLALVGESGSGKSVTALSILQLLPYPTAKHAAGSSIHFDGMELVGAPENLLQNVRGKRIGMIFQEPLTALNPLHTIRRQIAEAITLHAPDMTRAQLDARVAELMDLVELDQLKDRMGAYPHELSGGQRQRVMIAIALANNPDVLIADEPTTALDVTIQAQILALLQDLKKRLGMALLLITHDLAIVRHMADRVCVMQNGLVVEQNNTAALFNAPQHDYTKRLIQAEPTLERPQLTPDAGTLLDVQNLNVRFPMRRDFWGRPTAFVHAVRDVSITLKRGETLGIVGESGSGKTTLGMAILRLTQSSGSIHFDGQPVSTLDTKALRPLRAKMQVVFQDPFGSLSPRISVADIISEGLRIHRPDMNEADRDDVVREALVDVHLDPATRHRYPHEFSGGQRQRISIARTLVLNPALIVLDEPTSALDVSVQAQVVDVLLELQAKYGLSYLFISHDLRVVKAMAHRIVVMKDGQVVETGETESLLSAPKTLYAQTLLAAALHLKAQKA